MARSRAGRRPTGGRLHRLLILYCCLLAACGPKLGPPDVSFGQAEPLILVHPSTDPRRWYVPVESETLGPQIFFVDTGYGYTACDDDLVEGLGLKTKGRVRVRGELGALRATKTRLPDMQLGGHTLSNVTCQVRDIGDTSSIRDPREVPVAGVIGMDIFRQFRVVIDPASGQMHLLDPKTAEPLNRNANDVVTLRRERFGQRAKAPLSLQNQTVWPLLDTGSTTTWVDGERLGLDVSRRQEGVAFRGTGSKKRCHDCPTPDLTGPGHPLRVPEWATDFTAIKFLKRRFPDLSKAEVRDGLRSGLVRDHDGEGLDKRSSLSGVRKLVLYLPGIAPSSSPPTDVRTMYYYDLPQVSIGDDIIDNVTLTDRKKGAFEPGLLGLNIVSMYRQELDFRSGLARFSRIEPIEVTTWGSWYREGMGEGSGTLLDGGSGAVSEVSPP